MENKETIVIPKFLKPFCQYFKKGVTEINLRTEFSQVADELGKRI